MAEQTAQQPKEENPFEGFQTESYDRGEPVADPAPAPSDGGEGGVEEEGENEAPPAEEAEPPAAEGEEKPPVREGEPPRKKTVQERINEVTRARREAERRAEAAEAELQRLRSAQPQPPAQQPPVQQPSQEVDPDEPKADDFEYGELDPRYIRALATHEAKKQFDELRRQDAKAWEERAQKEHHEANRAKFETLIERGSKVHEDFYEKVVIGSEEGRWPMSEHIGQMALDSEIGNDILYHLATNPEEADRVFRSSPVEQARYFGKLEAKFSAGQAAASGDESGKPAPKTPKAPPPVEQARGAGGRFQASADTDDFLAFEQRANSER